MENNHTSEIGWMELWGELLKDCADDIAAGIIVGGIDAETLTEIPANGRLQDGAMKRKLDGLDALRFLRGENGSAFCWKFGVDPTAILAHSRRLAAKGARPQGRPRTNSGGTRARYIDLSGQRFGRLTVDKVAGTSGNGVKEWLCLCDCGNTCHAFSGCLRRGKKRSCGCMRALPNLGEEAA